MTERDSTQSGPRPSVEQQLDDVLNWIDRLANRVKALEIGTISGDQAHKLGTSLLDSLATARYALANPTVRIATVGTTSSGKSTLINALIGRCLAPTEAGQMSAGLLTFRHGPGFKYTVKKTNGAKWDTGERSLESDTQCREYTRDHVLRPYHEARQLADPVISEAPRSTSTSNRVGAITAPEVLEAPVIEIEAPLLPGADPYLLKLPKYIKI